MLILQAIILLCKIGSDHTRLALLRYTANDSYPLWLNVAMQYETSGSKILLEYR